MSSATFWTSAPSSNCNTLTLIPVSSLKPFRFAAMAVVGAVFSETKLSVVPENCFHMSALGEKDDPDPPHPAAPSSETPARPAPVILSKLLREYFFRIGKPLPHRPTVARPGESLCKRHQRCKRRRRQAAMTANLPCHFDARQSTPAISPSIEAGATHVNKLGSG